MTERKEQVRAEALALPPTERAALLEELLTSFEFPDRQDVNALWAKEAEDRIDAYESGEMISMPARQVFDQIDRQKAQ